MRLALCRLESSTPSELLSCGVEGAADMLGRLLVHSDVLAPSVVTGPRDGPEGASACGTSTTGGGVAATSCLPVPSAQRGFDVSAEVIGVVRAS